MTENSRITETETPAPLRRSVRDLVITHGLALLIILLVCWFVSPVFMDMFEDNLEALPAPTRFVLAISSWTNKHEIISIFIACALLAGDARFYMWLHRRAGARAARVWYDLGFALVISVIAFSAWELYLSEFSFGPVHSR